MSQSSLPTSTRSPETTAPRQELEAKLAAERRRLAKELHDTIGQSLTAAYLNAKFVERKLEKGGSAAAGDVFELGETIHRAVEELHGIMGRLLADGESAPGIAADRDSRTD